MANFDEHLLSQVKQVIPNVYDVGEFIDISDNEEFDPDQYDGPQFIEIDADGVKIQNLDDLWRDQSQLFVTV